MPSIKDLSDYIWKELPHEERVNIKGQAKRLEEVEPWFTYERLRNIRSGTTRHKERPEEIRIFKQVFAKELEGYDDIPRTKEEIEDYGREVEELRKEIDQLEKDLEGADEKNEDLQKALNRANDTIQKLLVKYGIIE